MAKIQPLQLQEVLPEYQKCYDFAAQTLMEEKNRNRKKNALHISVTCPKCTKVRWIRVSAIRSGNYQSPFCLQCIQRIRNTRPLCREDVEPRFQECYDFENQKVLQRPNSNRTHLHILVRCPKCGNQRWVVVSAIRCKNIHSPLCKRCSGAERPAPPRQYTDQHLIKMLQNRARELGRVPKTYEVTKPQHTTYRKYFGSWYAALKAAGFSDDEMPKCKGSPPYEYGPPPQIDDDLGCFLAGFVAGEGCFCVARHKNNTNRFGYGFGPYFRINLNERDLPILQTFQKLLGCGRISPFDKLFRHYFLVQGIRNQVETVIPFFRLYDFRNTFKQEQFDKWCHVVELLNRRVHLEREGFEMVYKLASEINTGFRSSSGLS